MGRFWPLAHRHACQFHGQLVKLPYDFPSTTQTLKLFSTHCYVDLRSKVPVSQGLGDPSVKFSTLHGVRKVLGRKELEFPIFLSESNDESRIVVEYGTVIGSTGVRHLHRSSRVSTAWDKVAVLCRDMNLQTDFSGCFNHFVNNGLIEVGDKLQITGAK